MKKNKFKAGLIGTGLVLTGGLVQELVINGNDWEPITSAPIEIQAQAMSQYKLTLSTGHRCSGFAVAPKILMTNNHCVPLKGITARVTNGPGETECTELLHTSKRHDYSLVLCPEADFTGLEFDANPIKKDDNIYVLHSNCDYYANSFCRVIQLYSVGKILSVNSLSLSHDADSLGGSSGAPILRDGRVIGIHNSGSGNDGFGNGTHNGGLTARGILENMPSVYRDQLKIKGNITLPQNNTLPYTPARPVYRPVKKKLNLWQRFKCLFKRSC